MKKLTQLLAILLPILVLGGPKDNPRTSIINTYYGTGQTLGMNFLTGKNIVFGGELSFFMGKSGVGKNYTGIFGPATYASDIYETKTLPFSSFSALGGKKISENVIIYTKVGFGSLRKYYNGYDPSQILDPSGYWHLTEPHSTTGMFGGGFMFTTQILSIMVSYDSFNKLHFGLGLKF
jgi:hypothetical protein